MQSHGFRPLYAVLLLAAGLALPAGAASAESAVQKECSEKYQAAKAANTLNGQTYNQYYKQCAAEAKAEKASPAATAATPAPTAAEPTKPPVATPAKEASTPAAPAAAGEAVYPTAVSPSFASLKPGKARMQTCLAQYHQNKATNGNGGMKWIEKGGGYYSECNKRLKG